MTKEQLRYINFQRGLAVCARVRVPSELTAVGDMVEEQADAILQAARDVLGTIGLRADNCVVHDPATTEIYTYVRDSNPAHEAVFLAIEGMGERA